ncbi:MAG: hypothetical protein RIB93_08700 [Coleofasciculus sp. D1-CHI-01]|uniref:hypothetical protein n=1 Tax=Coleofasciculus sp. D1-CHI-01 TaxID=3068482 RepID=UPI0032FD1914
MAIDVKVDEAVFAAVFHHNQPDKVAKRIMKLLEELSDGRSKTDDIGSFIETILDAIETDTSEELE